MRRLALIIAMLLAVPALALADSDGDDGSYTVRALFDNGAFAVKDEEVKVAGATVGSIEAVNLTDDNQAALSLKIDDSRFTPFHADARCTIRSEGLLAVKFVECDPGTSSEPELATIEEGDGEGQVLLSADNTTTPVDLDLVLNTYRQPTGQQLALLLSEFGAGLAGRGDELNEVVHRANPTLKETDQVLRILAGQNEELAQFAEDADSVVSALASRKRELAGFITGAAGTTQASASRSEELAATIDRLPAFLREFRGTMVDLERFTTEATPVLADLGASGQELGSAVAGLEPFARKAIPATESLGELADNAKEDLFRARDNGLIPEIVDLAEPLNPVATNLDKLTTSLRDNKARENLLKLFFFGTGATNGFDAAGHYGRVQVLSGACSEYTAKGFFGCDAQWGPTGESNGPVAASASRSSKKNGKKPPVKGGIKRAAPDPAGAAGLLQFLLGSEK